jgi:ferritin-like metal-binding protein YciE
MARELFVRRLQTMLWVEERLARSVLPLLRERVEANDLQWGLGRHLLETEAHARAVRSLLHDLGEPAVPLESPALVGLEAELPDADDDLAYTGAIARTEHLEIAAYTELRSLANALGEEEVAGRLQEILEQESYALELAEKARAKILAELVENPA